MTLTTVPGLTSSCLFHVTNSISKVCYLVDTGAEICVIAPMLAEWRNPPSSPPLTTVNGSTIPTYGQNSVTFTSASNVPFAGSLSLCPYPAHHRSRLPMALQSSCRRAEQPHPGLRDRSRHPWSVLSRSTALASPGAFLTVGQVSLPSSLPSSNHPLFRTRSLTA